MSDGKYQIPGSIPPNPLPIPNYVNVIQGYEGYSSDKIGPLSTKINKEIFGQVNRSDVNINEGVFRGNVGKYTPASFRREISIRVEAKLKDYTENLEIRREKLQDLLAQEEQNQIREIVDIAQRGKEDYLQNMKIRTQQLRAKREAERLEIVKQKKYQQYLENCVEFRPVLQKRRLKETKEIQRLQILEKENIKQSETEDDRIWYEMLMKQIDAQAAKEERNKSDLVRRNLEVKSTWDLQCKQHELAKLDDVREKKEDGIKLNNLQDALRSEEIARLDANRRKRDEFYKDTMSQIKGKQEALARQALEEKVYQEAINKQQTEERQIESEQKRCLREELERYNDYVKRLNQERKDDEQRLDVLIAQELKDIQDKQDKARQRYQKARQVLQKTVMEGRQEQIQHKQEEAEQQLMLKQMENQMLQMAHDQNERMMAEYARRQLLATEQYREELKQQMEQSKEMKAREREQIELQLLQGRIEEEAYKKNLTRVLNSDVNLTRIHPFRHIINKKKYSRPTNHYY